MTGTLVAYIPWAVRTIACNIGCRLKVYWATVVAVVLALWLRVRNGVVWVDGLVSSFRLGFELWKDFRPAGLADPLQGIFG